MQRLTIRQFRDTLNAAPASSALVCAYRELARRPELAAGMHAFDWVTWPPAAPARASA